MKTIPPGILEEMTRRLAEEFQPEAVILFGSHAWGQPSADIDLDLGELLTPYAVKFRYRGAVPEPQRAEYDQAQEAAEKLLAAVVGSLPPAYHLGIPPEQKPKAEQAWRY